MNTIETDIKILSLGKQSKYLDKAIASVTMLGSNEKLKWKQDVDALVITKPQNLPAWRVNGFKIEFKK